ncbi:MAG: ribosome-associated heat shock protein Hsp15 [Motiliproteus sp.]|jgi:ribosome-associated heat shock protein Hsp15
MTPSNPQPRIRLDKWLWAARFFKTRALSKQAIEGGKVQCNGIKAKVSKILEVGTLLQIRQGADEKTVEVLALSDQRRGAPEALLLYAETAASLALRAETAEQRKMTRAGQPADSQRPTKKDRRQIHSFIQRQQE